MRKLILLPLLVGALLVGNGSTALALDERPAFAFKSIKFDYDALPTNPVRLPANAAPVARVATSCNPAHGSVPTCLTSANER